MEEIKKKGTDHRKPPETEMNMHVHEDSAVGEHTHVLPDGTVISHYHETSDTAADTHSHCHGSTEGADAAHSHTMPDGDVMFKPQVNPDGSVTHYHIRPDGSVYSHTHSAENQKAVLNRLSRAIGHLQSIKTMVTQGRDCSEILIQLSAVKSALNNTGKLIIHDHMDHCIVEAIEHGDMAELEDFQKAIDLFIK